MNVNISNTVSWKLIALLAHAHLFISNGWVVKQPVTLKNWKWKCVESSQFCVWFHISEKENTVL